ncbi:Adseverin [Neolecta irregularis DAH-3]|uniref:Adseverin n=1 Tax=Neolecta irregularis (strain DAH-3) TaxID=1198029 RepID=A0A1U7LVE4_NEOID|nr:Adseverin [Neolecta irregularis DAH-3]|eukprot:OLL26543.1 Adseverin [Neolecta irregularis DAH-3]
MESFQESDKPSSSSLISHDLSGSSSNPLSSSGKKRATSVLSEDPQVQDWMEKVKSLQADREREDEERQRKLEQDIIAERRARQARRAERTRSISPTKATPAAESQEPSSLAEHRHDSLARLSGIKSNRNSFSQSPSRDLKNQRSTSSLSNTPVLHPPSRGSQPTSPLKQTYEEEQSKASEYVPPPEIAQALELGDTPVLKPFGVFPGPPPYDRPRSNTGTFDCVSSTPRTPTRTLTRERPISVADPSSGRERTPALPDSPLSLRQSLSSFRDRPAMDQLSYPLTQGDSTTFTTGEGSPVRRPLPTSPAVSSTFHTPSFLTGSPRSSIQGITPRDRPISPTKGAGGFVASALMRTDSSIRSRISAPASPASPLDVLSNTPRDSPNPMYLNRSDVEPLSASRSIDFSIQRARAESNPNRASFKSSSPLFSRKQSVPCLSRDVRESQIYGDNKQELPTNSQPDLTLVEDYTIQSKSEELHDHGSTYDSRSAASTAEPPPSATSENSTYTNISMHDSSQSTRRRKLAGRYDSPEFSRFRRSPPESISVSNRAPGPQSPTTPIRSPEVSHRRLSPTKNTWMDAALKRETLVIKKPDSPRGSAMNKTSPTINRNTPSPEIEKVTFKKLSPRVPTSGSELDLAGKLKTGKSVLKADPPFEKIDPLRESLLAARAKLGSKKMAAEINGPRVDEVKQRLLAAKNSLNAFEKAPKKRIDPVLERLQNAKSSLRPKTNLEEVNEVATRKASISDQLLPTSNEGLSYKGISKSFEDTNVPKEVSTFSRTENSLTENVSPTFGAEALCKFSERPRLNLDMGFPPNKIAQGRALSENSEDCKNEAIDHLDADAEISSGQSPDPKGGYLVQARRRKDLQHVKDSHDSIPNILSSSVSNTKGPEVGTEGKNESDRRSNPEDNPGDQLCSQKNSFRANKLATRINPNLSSIIAMGKSAPSNSSLRNFKTSSSSSIPSTGQSLSAGLQHLNKNRPRGPKRRVPNLQISTVEHLLNPDTNTKHRLAHFEAELAVEDNQNNHSEALEAASDDSRRYEQNYTSELSLQGVSLSNTSPEGNFEVSLECIPQQIPELGVDKAYLHTPEKLKPRKLVKKPRSPSPTKGTSPKSGKTFSKFRQSTSYQRLSSFLGGKLSDDDSNIDISLLYNQRPQYFIYPEGCFEVQVWRLIDGVRERLSSNFNTVYEDDTLLYLVSHGDSQKGQSIFLWLGLNRAHGDFSYIDSFAEEQGASLVRVHQGKETPTFLSVVGNTLITKYGSRDFQVQTASLFCIRSSSQIVFIDQRKLDVSSLCSAYSYVFKSYDAVWVWVGRGSQESEIIAAHDFALSLMNSVRSCYEGKEPEDFWDALGDGKYACAAFWRARRECRQYATRLFRFSGTQIAEISPFGMDDITADSIHVIDSFFDIMTVIGDEARKRRGDIQLALDFSRNYSLYVTKAEHRQTCTTSVLLAPWRLPSNLQVIFRLRSEVLPGCEFNSNLMQSMSLDEAFRIMDTRVFKIKDLQQPSLPLGVNPDHLDLWLSEKDYQLCMGLSKAEVSQKSEKEQEAIREDGLIMLRMLRC